jgi:hypothetical protein
MSYIKNEDLKSSDIPKSFEEGSSYFSHTFNGYEYGGSFQGCADISKKVQEAIKENKIEGLSLSELRTNLFFYFRAVRHGGGEADKSRVDKLLNLIRDRMNQGKFE